MTKRNFLASVALLTALATPLAAVADALPTPPRVEVIAAPHAGSWRVTTSGSRTVVERRDGRRSWSRTFTGRFALPVVTARGLRAGPSLDGTSIVLSTTIASAKPASTTSFAIVSRTRVRRLELAGRWAFDAVSPDGVTVFLAESIGRNQYWIRSVDVTSSNIGERLVTKTISYDELPGGPDGPMEGLALDRLMSPDELTAYTLYDGPSHPFVHALDTAHGGALCYDLPAKLKGVATKLWLRRGPKVGLIDIVESNRVVAQIADPTSTWGPAVLVAGTDHAPVRL